MGKRELCLALILLIMPMTVFSMTEGYIVCGSYGGTKTYLFDKTGAVVHTWDHAALPDNLNGYSCYLLENGDLLRSGQTNNDVSSGAAPKQGTLSEIDAHGNVVWGWYTHANKQQMMHHDFKPMPGGHILCVAFVTVARDSAMALGLDSTVFSSSGGMGGIGGPSTSIELEKIFEVIPDRTGGDNHQIVWEWNIWDHIIPKEQAVDHPELFSGDLGPTFFGQWVHLNGIDFSPEKNLIAFTSRIFSELFIIDHSTTTAEASGHSGGTYGKGGDLVYRWGKPSNFCVATETAETTMVISGFGTNKDTTYNITITKSHENDILHCLHCPNFIPAGYTGAGNVLFFHNNVNSGMGQLGLSEAIEVALPADLLLAKNTPSAPLSPTWKYRSTGTDTMFSSAMSSALRMKCGNTLVHEAYPGGNLSSAQGSRVREVSPTGEVVWGPVSLNPAADIVSDGGGGMMRQGFNAAKIMYYPEDYPGIDSLFNKKAIGTRTGARLNPVRTVGIVVKNRELLFTNVANAEITVSTLQGACVDRIHSSGAAMTYSARSLATGTYIVTAGIEGQGSIRRLFNVVR
ncbi:MAG: aryl-sulfate sulfotransferase [Chitinispirillaceae bacterium]|nr:aryl-sulfate sulfotransferase [Chitinispirillaceae bacterium]